MSMEKWNKLCCSPHEKLHFFYLQVQYMIEVMFQVRKDDFKAHPSISDGLDLVDEDDRIQHMITLEDNHDPEDILSE